MNVQHEVNDIITTCQGIEELRYIKVRQVRANTELYNALRSAPYNSVSVVKGLVDNVSINFFDGIKVEDLKISPWPWKCAINDCGEFVGVLTGRGFYVAKFACDIPPNDARLIGSAPMLYEALFEMVEMYRDGGSYDYEQEVIKTAIAALAKAAGECEGAE